MIRLATDEDLDGHIIRALRHRLPPIDIVRAYDAGFGGAPDEEILAWAARSDRLLLSHDASTMTAAAYSRMADGERMTGLLVIPQSLAIGLTRCS